MYICVVLVFGFVLHGDFYSGRLPVSNPPLLLQDSSIQYFFCGLLWLFTAPFLATLPPFMVFSVSHALNFICSDILPCFGYSQKSSLSVRIQNLVSSNSPKLMVAAAHIELFILIRLICFVLAFRTSAVIQLVFYTLFFKLRYQSSTYTHNAVQIWKTQVDSLVAHPSVPPAIKKGWIEFERYVCLGFGFIPGVPVTAAATTATSPLTKEKKSH